MNEQLHGNDDQPVASTNAEAQEEKASAARNIRTAPESKTERAKRYFVPFLERCGYESIQYRGVGTYGAVFAVRDPKDKRRQYALKICRFRLHGALNEQRRDFNQRQQRRFEQEFQIQRWHTFHRFLLSVHNYSSQEYEGFLYLWYTMELCVDTVREQIKKVELTARVELALQFMTGLNYLHYVNIVHRDIKPNNLLVDVYGRVKIADFGSAKVIGATEDQNTALQAYQIGAIAYMAPELFRVQYEMTQEEWAKCDQFSAGSTIYEMLSKGFLPYPEINEVRSLPNEAAKRARALQIYSERKRLKELGIPELPDRHFRKLNEVLAKMVAVRPGDRYSSIRHCVTELNNALLSYGLHPHSAARISVVGPGPETQNLDCAGDTAESSELDATLGMGTSRSGADPHRASDRGLAVVYAVGGSPALTTTILKPYTQKVWRIGSAETCAIRVTQEPGLQATHASIFFQEETSRFYFRDDTDGTSCLTFTLIASDGIEAPVASDSAVPLADHTGIRVGNCTTLVFRTVRSPDA